MNQIQILKNLTGEKRLKQALLLSDFTRELTLKNIKKDLGGRANLKTINFQLQKRLSLWR